MPGARLVDHLLVELADPPSVGQLHGEEAAIWDRAGVGDGERAGAAAGADRAGQPVPHDPRPQLGELLGWIPPVEHVEHVLELAALELRVGPGAPGQGVQLVDRHALLPGARRDRDDLLSQHVQRIAWHHGALDEALAHAARHDGALDEVGAELGEDAAARHLAHTVPSAPDALQAARHRLRRLDLDHEVDGAHVDTQLERRGRDQAGQAARLELVLDDETLLAGERSVMRAGDLPHRLSCLHRPLRRQVVEPQGDALRRSPVVHEHEGRAMLFDEAQQLGVDGRPDRASRGLPTLQAGELEWGVRFDHRLHRNVDAKVERLAHPGVDDGADTLRPHEEARHLVEWTLGGGKTDALDVAAGRSREPFQRQGQVRAALRLRDGMDLVDDDPLGAAEELARLRREHEVEGFRCGDEDVGGRPQHFATLTLRRVAGAHRDAHVGADAAQRRLEVAFDVVAERLERRDVDESERASPWVHRRGVGDEPVERPEEGGEGLARAGRRRDERVPARGDRWPGLSLGRRRLGEGARKPVADRRAECLQRGVRDGLADVPRGFVS